ncbi:MAG: C25 family cysteine peptidase [Candidatus Zixiibacteriota bacterium]
MTKRRSLKVAMILAIGLTLAVSAAAPTAIASNVLTIDVYSAEYQIIDTDEGQRIEMEGFGYLIVPGKPMLPAKNFLIALPPGTRVRSVQVEGVGATQLPGTYRMVPAPPIMPLTDPLQFPQVVEKTQREWRLNNGFAYSSDDAYPEKRGELTASGTLRKYSYASVSFCPFSYHPLSGKVLKYDGAQISIEYDLPSPGSPEDRRVEAAKWDDLADERASRLFVNFPKISRLYQPAGPGPIGSAQTHDYVIITTSALQSAIVASDFLDWKASLGYNVRTVFITDPEIAGQAGADLAEKIRNFLRYNYVSWGIEYLLLVGDTETIPMRYCYPNPANHTNQAGTPNATSGENPTDYYYADLSDPDDVSWDLDGDGYYGEYGHDSPDFMAEIYVGRIPTNNTARITYALNKSVSSEQDTGSWKNSALHGGAFWYLTNEDNNGRPAYDGATCMNEIEINLMAGWTVSHYSEQGGLEISTYPWPALSEAAFASDWRTGQYSIVNWGAHGWTDGAARKVWAWDDGDGVPENSGPNEMSWPYFIGTSSSLDDDHPCILFPISCVINYPEPNAWGNMGIDLLTEPSYGACVGVLAATRIVYGASGWPTNPGGGESMCYEFNRHMINGPSGPEKVGDAVYNSKFFCHDNYGFAHFAEYWNMVTYNLYGDPSLVREGTSSQFICGDCNGDGTIDVGDVVYLVNYLYKSGSAPDPVEAGDANGDETVDVGDVVYLINYLYKAGPTPGQ